MVAIVNVSKKLKSHGEQLYEVRINRKNLFQFKHNREYPLSTFLMNAAKAAEAYEIHRIATLIESAQEGK